MWSEKVRYFESSIKYYQSFVFLYMEKIGIDSGLSDIFGLADQPFEIRN
jgi:hypothetical protein